MIEFSVREQDLLNQKCQGANFYRTQCQGAYAYSYKGNEILSLKNRIDKNTEFKNLVLKGSIDKEIIKTIENLRLYLPNYWYQKMQKVIKDNENIESSYAVVLADDCIPGILENNKEIQVIIRRN